MTHVIAEPCYKVMDKACVPACPVDCIHPGTEMLYISPDECIDCGACVPACPVDAIFALDETPHKWTAFIAKNRNYFNE